MLGCFPKSPLLRVKKKEANYLVMLHNFINCPVFIGIKQTLCYKVAIE